VSHLRGVGAVVAGVALTIGPAVGCGQEDPEDRGPGRVVKGFLNEYRDGRYAEACKRLSGFAMSAVETKGPVSDIADPQRCAKNLAAKKNRPGGLNGERADDITGVRESDTADVAEVRTEDGEWDLDKNPSRPGGWAIRDFPRGY
jgi:hypothetical protein